MILNYKHVYLHFTASLIGFSETYRIINESNSNTLFQIFRQGGQILSPVSVNITIFYNTTGYLDLHVHVHVCTNCIHTIHVHACVQCTCS